MKNIKIILFLVFVMSILLLGVTNISATSDNTSTTKNSIVKQMNNNMIDNYDAIKKKNMTNPKNKIVKSSSKIISNSKKSTSNKEDSYSNENHYSNNMKKDNDNPIENNIKNVEKRSLKYQSIKKSATKTYDITDFNTLHDALTNDNYNDVTINLKTDIKLNKTIDLNPKITSLYVNGNNKKINGDKKYGFLYISSGKIIINKLTITNCKGKYGGSINVNNADLTISNSTFNANHANYGGAIFAGEYSILNINNSKFTYNTVSTINDYAGIGGSIYVNQESKLNISCSEFKNNKAFSGGAIAVKPYSIVKVKKTLFTNNTAENKAGVLYISGCVKINITNSTMTKNNAGEYYGYGGVLYVNGMDTPSSGEGIGWNTHINIKNSIIIVTY